MHASAHEDLQDVLRIYLRLVRHDELSDLGLRRSGAQRVHAGRSFANVLLAALLHVVHVSEDHSAEKDVLHVPLSLWGVRQACVEAVSVIGTWAPDALIADLRS